MAVCHKIDLFKLPLSTFGQTELTKGTPYRCPNLVRSAVGS